jgi:hypothetical protein
VSNQAEREVIEAMYYATAQLLAEFLLLNEQAVGTTRGRRAMLERVTGAMDAASKWLEASDANREGEDGE